MMMQPIDEDLQGGTPSSEDSDSGMGHTRDGQSPIARLPPEVLLRIFGHVVAVEHYQCSYLAYRPPPPRPLVNPYFSLTHVCRYWRTLSRADPSLWTTPDFDHPRLALEMLALAQDIPLSVHVSADESQAPGLADVIEELAKLPHRAVRELHVTDIVDDLEWMSQITGSMFALEQLYLERSSGIWYTPHIGSLVSGDFPRLRKLTLIDVTAWHSVCLSNLTALTIEITTVRAIDGDIATVLRRNPMLETLTLLNFTFGDVAQGFSWDARSSLQPVHLPHLRDLLLSNRAEALSFLLSSMVLPKLQSLEVRSEPDDDRQPALLGVPEVSNILFPNFFYRLSAILNGMGIEFTGIEANCRGSLVQYRSHNFSAYNLWICCKGRRLTSADQDVNHTPPVLVTISFCHSGRSREPGPVGFLSDFLQHLTLEYVQRVVVMACHLKQAGDTRSSQQPHLHRLWKILSAMPMLGSLTITRDWAFGIPPGLLAELGEPPVRSWVATEAEELLELPFPALKNFVYKADAVYPLQSCLQSHISALRSISRRRDDSGKVPPLSIELRQDLPGKKIIVKVLGGEASLVETDEPVHTFEDAWQAIRREIHAKSDHSRSPSG